MTKHGQRQHRITEWYLRSFARMTKSGAELAVYDLHTGAFDWHVVSTFMAPINDHSKEIENGSLHVSTHSRQVVERVIEELCYSPESTPRQLGPD